MDIATGPGSPITNTVEGDSGPLLSRTWLARKGVTDKIIELRGQIAELEMQELRQRVQVYTSTNTPTASGKDQEADVVNLDLKLDLINLKADLRAKEDFRDMLNLAIEHGIEIV
jgi:hypothetical protein